LLSTIPAHTPVFAQSNLAPHLSQRPTLYGDFAYFTDPDFRAAAGPVADIVLDITSLENIGGLHQFLRQALLESGDYQLLTAQDGLLHLRPASQPEPPLAGLLQPSFYTFTQPGEPLDYRLQVDFGQAMRLHGYSLHFERQEEIRVTLDLELLQPVPVLQPVLYLLDAQGQPLGATVDLQPGLVWFPPELWPVGQKMRVRFNTLPWYTRQTPAYRLALGVVEGADVWALGSRQQPSLSGPTEFAVRFPAGGSLIELAYIEQPWGMPQGGLRLRQFTRPSAPKPIQANFADQLHLFGYSTNPISQLAISNYQLPITNSLSPHLSLTLYWQAITTPEPLTRFVQLIGPDGMIYGQHDSAPDLGLYPTDHWQPGEVVVETVTVPVQANRPPGAYRLHVGWYRPASGERLPVRQGGDHIEIQYIE
jgi:hypothetical protein